MSGRGSEGGTSNGAGAPIPASTTGEKMRARSLLRRYVWATVALGLFAGVAGGAAIGLWGVARRTSSVFDRFVASEGAPTLSVFGCTDGVTQEEIEATDYSTACGDYDYADVLDFLDSVPAVESAGRWTLAISWVSNPNDPTTAARQLVPVRIDAGADMGSPIVVAGRAADPNVAAEATVNEEAGTRFGVGLGDRIDITPYRVDEFDLAGEGTAPGGGTPTMVTVVGITRRPADLVGRLGGTSIYEDTSVVDVGPAWWDEVGGDAANYSIAVVVQLAPGAVNADVMSALQDRWPDRPFFAESGPLRGGGGQETVVDAISLQSLGLELVALVVALAGLVFVGQAIARQTRREWTDASILDALGMTRSSMMRAALRRTVVTAALAAATAAIVAIALSPFGPIGIGRAGEPDPGFRADGFTLIVGLPLLCVAVISFAVIPLATIPLRPRMDTVGRSRSSGLGWLPPTGVAGWAMTSSRRAGGMAIGSAVIGVAIASAAGIAATSLMSSYHELIADPARYGSTWDAQVGNVGNPTQAEETKAKLAGIPGIRAVGVRSGTGIGDDPTATLFAAEPFLGDVAFGVITDGRTPVARNEIALGHQTMDEYGTSVGGTVELANPNDLSETFRFDVVGEVVVNDTLTAYPGRGALVTGDTFDHMATALSQTYVVWIDDGVPRAATLEALQRAFPTTFLETATPQTVRNLGLVSDQPILLAALVGILAGAALIHALITSVRRGRRQIAVLETLGFTSRQVAGSVAWHASLLALGALILGVPLGIIVGRVTWTAVMDDIGLVSQPALSLPAVLAVVLIVLAVANLAAFGPGWAASRIRPATALRTE